MTFNLATILRESARATPGKVLAHAVDRAFTYAEVDEISGRVASSLLATGLRPGQTVALQLPNVPQFVFAYFGILKAGLVMLPLNPLLKAREIAYHLGDSDAAALVTLDLVADEATKAVAELGELPVYVVRTTSAEPPAGTRAFEELYRAPDTGEIAPTDADDTPSCSTRAVRPGGRREPSSRTSSCSWRARWAARRSASNPMTSPWWCCRSSTSSGCRAR
jgi:long-chain acyl-CoA synthetase